MSYPQATAPQLPVVLVVCEHCKYRAPVALVSLIIQWGPETSSDMLRHAARCTKCGRKGAALQHPSWASSHFGWEPFPAKGEEPNLRK